MRVFEGVRDGVVAEGRRANEVIRKDFSRSLISSTAEVAPDGGQFITDVENWSEPVDRRQMILE
jgi:hypothetical protein